MNQLQLCKYSSILLVLTSCTSVKKLPKGFVYLNDKESSIVLDLKYFSKNNFVGDTIDG